MPLCCALKLPKGVMDFSASDNTSFYVIHIGVQYNMRWLVVAIMACSKEKIRAKGGR